MDRRKSLSEVIFPPQLATSQDAALTGYTSNRSSIDSSEDDWGNYRETYKQESDINDEYAGLVENDSSWKRVPKNIIIRQNLVYLARMTFGLLAIVLILTVIISRLLSGHSTFQAELLNPIPLEALMNGTFYVERDEIAWLREAGDGVYTVPAEYKSIRIVNLVENTTRLLVDGRDVLDENNSQLFWSDFYVSADLKYILFTSEKSKIWRHSHRSQFWVHEVEAKRTKSLQPRAYPPELSIAKFSPVNHHIAFVKLNDIYIFENPSFDDTTQPIRLTVDGSATTFNGIPDWAYEEEVLEGDTALWWSPDASKLAYLTLDEKDVPEYEYPIYNQDPYNPGGAPYPLLSKIKYPKPGFPNPVVRISVFDLKTYLENPHSHPDPLSTVQSFEVRASTYNLKFEAGFAITDTIISEVAWVGKNDLMVKMADRSASTQKVYYFGFTQGVEGGGDIWGKAVRQDDFTRIDGGWVENGQYMVGIESTRELNTVQEDVGTEYSSGYLDIIPNEEGYRHVAYFSPPNSSIPIFLSSGKWEIDGGIKRVDIARGRVYFMAANPAIERHLYAVSLPDRHDLALLHEIAEPAVISNTTVRGYHDASFSPFGQFYVLENKGPDIPWQRMYNVEDPSYVNVLNTNFALKTRDDLFVKADVVYTTIEIDGIEMNVMEVRPPRMDESGRTKYPMLVSVYGGPESQKVDTRYLRDFSQVLATSFNYFVLMVDVRGTGLQGRKMRIPVRNQLGHYEASDTIEVARQYSSKPFIDSDRVGVWGWSYGGYLTCKIVEANSSVFNLAMAVAPVTDWRYYDSIYTERFMSTPATNEKGYQESAITQMDGFKHVNFLLAHGSGDDNVHYLNSAVLLDRLTVASVRNFVFRMFTDSDHSMSARQGYSELMNWMMDFLQDKWGLGGRTKNHWKIAVHQIEREREKL